MPRLWKSPRAVRRYVAVAAMLALGLAVALWQLSRTPCFALVGTVICHVPTTQRAVALSFDDGPTDLGVDAILPVLAAHHAHATFFVIGQELAQRPALARRLLAAGNELGNHSFHHRRMVGQSMAVYRDEVRRTDALIRAVGGTPGLFRPPYGKKLLGLPLVLRAEQRVMVMADVVDPATTDPAVFARRIVAAAQPGSILLVHAMYRANGVARAALPAILDGLAAKRLQVVTVGQLRAGAAPG